MQRPGVMFRACVAARIAFFAACVLAAINVRADLSAPGPYPAGWRTVTVTRANSTTFSARLFYPAVAAGQNTAIAPGGGAFPGISFGHGFLQGVTQYQTTCAHLATHGYIVIASESEGSLSPSHSNFASDLSRCITYLEQENASPASQLFGRVNTLAIGMSGHSMGGGASVLAAAADVRVKALATMAAAETTPSAIAAAANLRIPASYISGSMDTIVPPPNHGQLMYGATPSPRLFPMISGGFHCGFVDANFLFCDSGSITRAAQLSLTRALLTAFFDLYLKGDQSRWGTVWGPGVAGVTLASDARITVLAEPDSVEVAPGGEAVVNVTITNTGAWPASYAIASDSGSAEWLATPAPATTPEIGPGASSSATVTIRALAAGGAPPTMITVSARSLIDQGTRAYTGVAATVRACSADFDGDGDVGTDSDIEAYFLCLGGTCCPRCGSADFDGDGDVGTDADIESFFRVLGGGTC